MRCATALLAAFVLFPAAATAQQACPNVPDILALAQTILTDREALPRLQARRFGTEAAYLQLHYGLPDNTTPDMLFAALDGSPEAPELIAAYTVVRDGIPAGLAILDPDPVRAFALAGPSTRRAILLADAGQSYFALLQQAFATPELDNLLLPSMVTGADLLPLVTAEPDDAILALSKAAAAQRFLLPAATLAAALSDLTEFNALTAAHATDPAFAADPVGNWYIFNLARLVHDADILPRPPAADGTVDPTRAETDLQFFVVNRAAYHSGPATFISTVLNQSFLTTEVAIAAQAYLDEVAAGRLDPIRDPESAWLFQYRALAAVMGRDTVQQLVGYFDFPPPRLRHYGGTAQTSLDWMLASETLRPVVLGETTAATRPALLSDGFDWPLWLDVATQLGRGNADAIPRDDPARVAVAAELLAQTQAIQAAQDIATTGLAPPERLAFLRDLMQRLDRQCDGAMTQPGQALLLGGDFLFKF